MLNPSLLKSKSAQGENAARTLYTEENNLQTIYLVYYSRSRISRKKSRRFEIEEGFPTAMVKSRVCLLLVREI